MLGKMEARHPRVFLALSCLFIMKNNLVTPAWLLQKATSTAGHRGLAAAEANKCN